MADMTRRQLLRRTGGVGLTGLLGAASLTGSKTRGAVSREGKPNIVFILVDDLGWSELGCYGNAFNDTPHIDALAQEGMRFTDAYASAPVCSPTRAALMTGQHPARVGITNYLGPRDEKFLSPDHLTLNEVLKQHGYVTGLIGKWHLTGDYRTKRGEPAKHGWDEVICSETSYIAGGKYFHPYFFMKEVKARSEGEYLVDRMNDEAVEFITRHKREPFFLYLSHYAVHTRLSGKKKLVEKYKDRTGAGKKRNNPELAAMIESIDQGVGRIVRTLRKLGLDKDTLIVFASDNGGDPQVTSNAPLRAAKSFLYEGGIRVPLIVRWPGVVRRGSTCNVPVVTHDFYPTFAELSGATIPPDRPVDGTSVLPLLTQRGGIDREALYWHYPLRKPHFLGGKSAGAVRQGDYKLIEHFETGELELYNLKRDLGEQRDMRLSMPGKVIELHRRLTQWRKEVGASMPPAGAGSRNAR